MEATDILCLLNSMCKTGMAVTKVEVRPSQYGKEKMKQDALYGPPPEIFSNEQKPEKEQRIGSKFDKVQESSKSFHLKKLREYEF